MRSRSRRLAEVEGARVDVLLLTAENGRFREAIGEAGAAWHPFPLARDHIVGELGVRSERVRVILDTLELRPPLEGRQAWRAKLEIADDSFVATMLALLHRFKDHETLLRAWRIVLGRLAPDDGAVLLLAGRPVPSTRSGRSRTTSSSDRDCVSSAR